ncbi:MAG TPA: holo-ACP synthase [Burkholderiaceae bacterium]|jgi:holo-[acyl-carrier protein] synthase|nr:holo-ACP synthase [Burkholderiaceae bacterium]
MLAHAGNARIAGIGMDLLRLDRVQRVFDRHPERFVRRILGEDEILVFQRRYQRDPRRGIRYLATRFAAKEAFSKAVGLGMRMPMAWSRMQTLNAPGGRPYVKLAEPLAAWYGQRFGMAHVSVTDEHDIVAAYVVVESLVHDPLP